MYAVILPASGDIFSANVSRVAMAAASSESTELTGAPLTPLEMPLSSEEPEGRALSAAALATSALSSAAAVVSVVSASDADISACVLAAASSADDLSFLKLSASPCLVPSSYRTCVTCAPSLSAAA
eukprot:scaffold96910_cov48-Phaeocystis_antarctica.AAC.1